MEKASLELAFALAKKDPANIQYWDGSNWRIGTANPNVAVQRDSLGTTHHESGTLWMGDPGSSVTDVNGRFHHVTNAYVAGPALFPTMGSANPTLTAVSLARRTAEAIVAAATPA